MSYRKNDILTLKSSIARCTLTKNKTFAEKLSVNCHTTTFFPSSSKSLKKKIIEHFSKKICVLHNHFHKTWLRFLISSRSSQWHFILYLKYRTNFLILCQFPSYTQEYVRDHSLCDSRELGIPRISDWPANWSSCQKGLQSKMPTGARLNTSRVYWAQAPTKACPICFFKRLGWKKKDWGGVWSMTWKFAAGGHIFRTYPSNT